MRIYFEFWLKIQNNIKIVYAKHYDDRNVHKEDIKKIKQKKIFCHLYLH